MATLFISCLSLVALPMIADAMRTDTSEILNISRHEAGVNVVSKFSFKLKQTPCAALDFGNMKSIVEQHPKALKKMQAQGTKWANEYNCRLCDLEGDEHNLLSPVLRPVVVKCHAYSSDMKNNLETACQAGNGKPGWRKGGNEAQYDNICLPCPKECELCKTPGQGRDKLYPAHKWFKCILPAEEQPTPVSAPWSCEPVTDRRKHPGKLQWCKYRNDLVKTSTNGYNPEPSTSWQLAITAARCDKTEYDANEMISTRMKALTPKLNKLTAENCELCRIMLGGSKASESGGEVVIGESSSNAWVDTRCAYDELKTMACRADQGSTGWAKTVKCAPCPHECASCEDKAEWFGKSNKFKCNLRIPQGAGERMAEIMLGSSRTVKSVEIHMPLGYECDHPKEKSCLTGEGVCIRGYKTLCKYKGTSY